MANQRSTITEASHHRNLAISMRYSTATMYVLIVSGLGTDILDDEPASEDASLAKCHPLALMLSNPWYPVSSFAH